MKKVTIIYTDQCKTQLDDRYKWDAEKNWFIAKKEIKGKIEGDWFIPNEDQEITHEMWAGNLEIKGGREKESVSKEGRRKRPVSWYDRIKGWARGVYSGWNSN